MKDLKALLNRVINKIILIEDSYKLKIQETQNIEISSNTSEFSLELMTYDDLFHIEENYPIEFSEYKNSILGDRIRDKMKLVFVAKEKNKIIGYFSVAYDEAYESGIKQVIHLDDFSCYLYDDYVFKEHRGRGVHQFSVIERIKKGKEDNKKFAIVNIYRNNQRSKFNYKILGFEPFLSYYYIPIFNKLFVRKMK